MRRIITAVLGATTLALALVGPAPGVSASDPGLPAVLKTVSFPKQDLTFPTVDYGDPTTTTDDRSGTTTWRVIKNSGNCCENYLATTPSGRLIDFGGSYIHFSDDGGVTWTRVGPNEPLVNGEGAVTYAPGGDIVGVEWDPYSGDHLLSFKYDALQKSWFYDEEPIHTPFFDREWVGIVPGPITIGPVTAPYLVFLRGGYPSKDVWYMSTDGLTYTYVTDRDVEQLATTAVMDRWLTEKPDADADWYQPNTASLMTPLSNGSMLAAPEDYISAPSTSWSLLDPSNLTWNRFSLPGGTGPAGIVQTDSLGRLNEVISNGSSFDYRISADGGKTWSSTTVALPLGSSIENIDFKANAALGVAAVAIHAHNAPANLDQDYVYRLGIAGPPYLQRFYRVGRGDLDTSSGLGASIRFDFETVAILPDGRIAVSFIDSQHQTPAVAIEQTTTFP